MAGNWVVVWTSTTVGAPIPGKARPMALQNFREFDDHNEAVCFVMEQLSANEQTSSRLARTDRRIEPLGFGYIKAAYANLGAEE
jgi:hypothetical protein